MNWLALSPMEVAALWIAASGLALWLYLHHRRPVRKRVSTLRFWASAESAPHLRRRRLREPWAFLAQILFLLFVILALANPRWGLLAENRSVAIVMDTSLWSQMSPANGTPWIDQVRQQTLKLVNSLPSGDRVLLLRAEADAPPVLPFTTDRASLRSAIQHVRPSNAIADIPRALGLGRSALAGSRRSLLVYVGPGMLDDEQVNELEDLRESLEPGNGNTNGAAGRPQFLIRLIGERGPIENRGITRLALRRDEMQPDHWHLLAELRNYGASKSSVLLTASVGDHVLVRKPVMLGPGEVATAHEEFAWAQSGLLQAQISPSDALDADNQAVAYLPAFSPVRVTVFSGKDGLADELRPLLSMNPYVRAEYLSPGTAPATNPDVEIFDAASKPARLTSNSILFLKGTEAPHPVRVVGWNEEHPATRWVRTQDVSVRSPASIAMLPGDTILASGEGDSPAPLIVARQQDGHKQLIVGFDPRDSNLPEQSAFPLLMAGGIEWMTHPVEDVAGSLSAGELSLATNATRIVAPSGRDIPFAREGQDIRLFAPEVGLYRVFSGNVETNIAVNTPVLPSERWSPDSSELASVTSEPLAGSARDLWRWLVGLAIMALWAERWLFYRQRNRQIAAGEQSSSATQPKDASPAKGRGQSVLHSLRFFG